MAYSSALHQNGQRAPGRIEQAARRAAEWLYSALAARAAPRWIIGIALLLTSTALTLDFSVDELVAQAGLLGQGNLEGISRAPWDLYTFSSGPAMNRVLMDEGVLPWWTDPEFALNFLRPLASLSLWADHMLWPHDAVLPHLHSLMWFGVLLSAVWLVYREFFASSRAAALALLLYAIDDARAFLVGWIALRNALMALAPALLALVCHHRWRTGRGRHFAWLALLCLALGFGSGEMAVTVYGYLAAYALFLERGALWQRARSLLPYLALLLVYRVIYQSLGYGTWRSGLYFDPSREPLRFLAGLLTRLPLLVFSEFAPLPSELWLAYPMVAWWVRPVVFVAVLGGLVVLGRVLWPLLRASAESRFWALGCVLSTVPVCGAFLGDRLLTATSLGGAALLSTLLLSLFEGTYPQRTRFVRGLGYTLLAVHGVMSPLVLTVRTQDFNVIAQMLEDADRSIARSADIADQTLVLVNPPLAVQGVFFLVYREAKGIPLPGEFHFLATAESALEVTGVDAHSLKLRPRDGFLATPTQRMFRAARPFAVGEQIRLRDLSMRVTALTEDSRPAEVVVRFDKRLDDPSLLLVASKQRAYAPFRPPAAGESVVLPEISAFSLF